MKTVFYSWQSDSPSALNRTFIKSCLDAATSRLSEELNEVVNVDNDTRQSPGAPSISDEIFRKISDCDVFVCDVTTAVGGGSRKSINPNVAIELGYAVKAVGWGRIVMVMNTRFGDTGDLPFHLAQRRWPLRYELQDSDQHTVRADRRKRLGELLRPAIMLSLQKSESERIKNPKDVRVARALVGCVTHVAMAFADYFRQHGMNPWSLELFPDNVSESKGDFPEQMGLVIKANGLLGLSNLSVNGRRANWAESILRGLHSMRAALVEVLGKYADRDDWLIGSAEKVKAACETQLQIVSMVLGYPERHLQEVVLGKGMDDQHVTFWVNLFRVAGELFHRAKSYSEK